VVGPLASTVFPLRVLRSPISDLSAAKGFCIGKADGELLHKLLSFFAYPSTLCFFAFMLVAQALLLITDHSPALFFVCVKLGSL
jgi:hypothetical protein